jgi:AcrR family transcriptional regulator
VTAFGASQPDSPRVPAAEAVDTRTRLLDAAEKLFATQGIEATSLRRVTREAKANLAAVHYHFGSKEALVEAVFARRVEPLNRERLRLLDLAEAGEEPPSVESILEAFLRPALQLMRGPADDGRMLMRLMGRAHLEASDTVRSIAFAQFQPLVGRFVQAFRLALPELPLPELLCRLRFTLGAMAFTMMHLPPLEAEPESVGSETPLAGVCVPGADDVVRSLVRFLAAGMRSSSLPVSPPIEEGRP